jgi:hypothetical protein
VSLGTTALPSPTTSFAEVTYTAKSDCFTGGTATSLGMNNIYYQYYSFSITKGSNTYSTTFTYAPSTTGNKVTVAVNGCTHSHLYNWMA